jgi:hypothetical protein
MDNNYWDLWLCVYYNNMSVFYYILSCLYSITYKVCNTGLGGRGHSDAGRNKG